jgi:hypothetical protein
MKSWGKAIGFGALVWLMPFVVAFIIYLPLHESSRPLFESIMAVAVCGTAVGFGLLYLRPVGEDFVKEGILVGLLWLIMSILIDAPLMLFGGPMQMSFSAYMADIGVTYLCIPVITWGLGVGFAHASK